MRGTVFSLIFGIVFCVNNAAFADGTTTTSTCMVQDAATAAVQKQIALIDAAKVNPADFFTGQNSCISPDLMKQFDLSNLIPDLSGMLTSGATDMLTNILNQAKQKVCSALDQQLQSVVSKINSNMMSFQGQSSGQLSSLLNGSITNVTIPNIPNIGQFSLTSLSSGAIAPVSIPQPATQTYSAGAATVPAPVATPTSPDTSTSSGTANTFGNIFKQ